ncbi:MAG: DUF4038 domain-containing protein [Planctomycetota bacterium]
MRSKVFGVQNCVVEFSLSSSREYRDPLNEVELDVLCVEPDGTERRVPAFWAGGREWRVRYASPTKGAHQCRTICSDTSNASLHNKECTIEITEYQGQNPLLLHGPIRVVDNHHFEHWDGTPFFWLGDTWWMGLSKRLGWPEEFQLLVADRVARGFTVIQIVAGLYPDMPPFDPRGENEAGWPWDKEFRRINPSYFDMADRRIHWLVRAGLAPCIVGCWGYYIDFAGVEAMKKHWRYLVARYGAYPVIWCMAGEATMLYYLSPARENREKREQAMAAARAGWTEVTRYSRSINSYGHPITLHPSQTARETVDDPSVMDFDMLQTGHNGWRSMPNTVRLIHESRGATPKMPTVVGEVCYEGIMGGSWEDVQRFAFWASMLSGAVGYTYGANGIWQLNRPDDPFGNSPHGTSWGGPDWQEAWRLPGSQQVALGKELLERYEFWKFEPHPEWVEPHATKEDYYQPYAAGIPGTVRVIYIPPTWSRVAVAGLEGGRDYRAYYFNPRNAEEVDLGDVHGDSSGRWAAPPAPIRQDWVLVIESK